LDIPEVGYEGKTGRDLKFAAYFGYTMDENTCSVVAEAVRAAGFCEAFCDLCGWASGIPERNYDLPVEVPVAGFDGATCGDLLFPAYYNATIATSTCPAVAEAAKSAGCCYSLCSLCGFGAEVPDDPFSSTTCEDLSLGADFNYTIGEDGCAAAILLAETEGCCVPLPTYDCNVCGDATFYPDNAIYSLGTCEETLPFLNATECAQLTPDFARFCCATPSGISSAVPSSAPQESTTSEPGAPSAAPDEAPSSPTSTSVAIWSSSTLVSLMGLTVRTTSGTLILN
jgi:hypothetical protein